MIDGIYVNRFIREKSAAAGKKRDVFHLPFEYRKYFERFTVKGHGSELHILDDDFSSTVDSINKIFNI